MPAAEKIVKLPNSNISTKLSFALIKMWCQRYHQRKRLAQLDERMLKDIGITPEEAYLHDLKESIKKGKEDYKNGKNFRKSEVIEEIKELL